MENQAENNSGPFRLNAEGMSVFDFFSVQELIAFGLCPKEERDEEQNKSECEDQE